MISERSKHVLILKLHIDIVHLVGYNIVYFKWCLKSAYWFRIYEEYM